MLFKQINNGKIFFVMVLLSMLTISGCNSVVNKNAPKIELSTTNFNWGDINPDDGIITETFKVKNVGNETLNITYISTSCACTTATVDSNELNPGEETTLTISYDPSVHEGLVGPIKRMVYIESNDPNNQEAILTLTGNSLPSSNNESKETHTDDEEHNEIDDHDEEYEGLLTDYEISPPGLYDKIKDGDSFKLLDVREDFEYEESHINGTLLLSVNKISQENLDKLGLKKDDEIVVYCRSGRRSAQAYEVMKSLGYTNVKSLYGGIVHWEEDKFPVVTGNEANADNSATTTSSLTPKIEFDKADYDFGNITQFGGVVNTTFEVRNTGEADLHVTAVSTSCGCTTAKVDETVIAPGEKTTLTVFFDPDFHEEPAGRFSRTVFLETNDPANPEAEVKMFVDILEGK